MRRVVIVNTSPLFYLHRLGCLGCLENLYGEIVIPEAVLAELEEGGRVGEEKIKFEGSDTTNSLNPLRKENVNFPGSDTRVHFL